MSAVLSSAAQRRRQRARKALRIAIFCVCLVLGVLVALAILVRYTGSWGVPYFHFTTERGSRCVNTFTGFTCDPVLADVNYFGGVELPASARVVTGHYRSTHDYQLNADLEVPAAASAAAATALRESFGGCVRNHPSPLNDRKLTGLCVFANDTDVTESGVPDSRVFVVATGVRADKVRLISLSVRSR